MAIKANLIIDQGTDFSVGFDLTDDNDQILDLTGYTGRAEMRKHYTSSNGYVFSVSISGNTGELNLTMNAVTTNSISAGRYVYDCELEDVDGLISRVVEGIVTVTPRVKKT